MKLVGTVVGFATPIKSFSCLKEEIVDLTWKLKQLETSGEEANLKEHFGIKQVMQNIQFDRFSGVYITQNTVIGGGCWGKNEK